MECRAAALGAAVRCSFGPCLGAPVVRRASTSTSACPVLDKINACNQERMPEHAGAALCVVRPPKHVPPPGNACLGRSHPSHADG